jgi:hypothetical protein
MISSLLHFIWIQQRAFGKVEYICIKSALKNTPYLVVLHTNLKPGEAGIYCPYPLQSERFLIIYNDYSLTHRGVAIRAATLSDILRIQILQEHGGIYSDMDMLWLQPIPEEFMNNTLLSTWQNESYKIATNCLIASQINYDFSPLLKEFDAIFDSLNKRNKNDISGDSLKEHLTLFKSTCAFLRNNSSMILKKKYFGKNTWKNVWRFMTDQVPESKIVLTNICGFHLCGCGLFGEYKCNTFDIINKHSKLKALCDSLLQE